MFSPTRLIQTLVAVSSPPKSVQKAPNQKQQMNKPPANTSASNPKHRRIATAATLRTGDEMSIDRGSAAVSSNLKAAPATVLQQNNRQHIRKLEPIDIGNGYHHLAKQRGYDVNMRVLKSTKNGQVNNSAITTFPQFPLQFRSESISNQNMAFSSTSISLAGNGHYGVQQQKKPRLFSAQVDQKNDQNTANSKTLTILNENRCDLNERKSVSRGKQQDHLLWKSSNNPTFNIIMRETNIREGASIGTKQQQGMTLFNQKSKTLNIGPGSIVSPKNRQIIRQSAQQFPFRNKDKQAKTIGLASKYKRQSGNFEQGSYPVGLTSSIPKDNVAIEARKSTNQGFQHIQNLQDKESQQQQPQVASQGCLSATIDTSNMNKMSNEYINGVTSPRSNYLFTRSPINNNETDENDDDEVGGSFSQVDSAGDLKGQIGVNRNGSKQVYPSGQLMILTQDMSSFRSDGTNILQNQRDHKTSANNSYIQNQNHIKIQNEKRHNNTDKHQDQIFKYHQDLVKQNGRNEPVFKQNLKSLPFKAEIPTNLNLLNKKSAVKTNQVNHIGQSVESYLKNGTVKRQQAKAPQEIIASMKKETSKHQQSSDQYKAQIQTHDKTITAVKKKIQDLKQNKERAITDLKEIKRDLSIYEHNFSQENGIRDKLVTSLQKLQELQTILKKRVVYQDGKKHFTDNSCKCEGVIFNQNFLRGTPDQGRIRRLNFKNEKTQHFQDHMLKFIQEQHVDQQSFQEDFDDGIEIDFQQLKKSEISVKFDILKKLGFQFDPYQNDAGDNSANSLVSNNMISGDAVKIGSKLKRGQKSQCKLDQIGNDNQSYKLEDGYPHIFIFSGIPCMIVANFLSGQVEIRVSLPFTTQMLKHDFNFTNKKIFGSSELKDQFENLVFNVKRRQKKESKDVKQIITLQDKHKSTSKSYLLQILGQQSKHTPIDININHATQQSIIKYRNSPEQLITLNLDLQTIFEYLKGSSLTRARTARQLQEKDVAKYVKRQALFFESATGKVELLQVQKAQEMYESEMPVERMKYLMKIKEFLNAGTSQMARQRYEELNLKMNESPRSKRSSQLHTRKSIREKSQMDFQLFLQNKENQKSSLKEHQNDQKNLSKFSQANQRIEALKQSTTQSLDTRKSKLKKTGKYNSTLNLTKIIYQTPEQNESPRKEMFQPLLEQGYKKKKYSKSVKVPFGMGLGGEKSGQQSQKKEGDDFAQNDSRNEYILLLKMHFLKSQKPKDADVQKLLTDQEEAAFNKYDLVYCHRYQKTQKQYLAYQNQIQKRNRIVEQQEEEQDQIYDDFITNIKQGIDMKTRATDNENKIRKKYFRQPKIYQNDYIDLLYMKKKFRYFHTIPDSTSKKHVILFIFFTEKKEFFLLLGRRANENELENSSSGSKSSCSGLDKQDKDKNEPEKASKEEEQPRELSPLEKLIQQRKMEEEQKLKNENPNESDADDDSPYFVKITLDEMFLSHLQMPDIISGADVENRYENIIHNEIFRQIVQREITMMFGEGDNESDSSVSDSDANKGQSQDKNDDNRLDKLISIDKIDRDVIDEADEINLYRTGTGSEILSRVGSSSNIPQVLGLKDGKATDQKDTCNFVIYNQQLIEQKEIEERKAQEKMRVVEEQMKKFLGSYSNILTNS